MCRSVPELKLLSVKGRVPELGAEWAEGGGQRGRRGLRGAGGGLRGLDGAGGGLRGQEGPLGPLC